MQLYLYLAMHDLIGGLPRGLHVQCGLGFELGNMIEEYCLIKENKMNESLLSFHSMVDKQILPSYSNRNLDVGIGIDIPDELTLDRGL